MTMPSTTFKLLLVYWSICILVLLCTLPYEVEANYTTMVTNPNDGLNYCQSYDILTAGSLITFEKCNQSDAKQMSWIWVTPFLGKSKSRFPGMNCINSNPKVLCDGIGADGKGRLLVKNVTDPTQLWTQLDNGQFINEKTGRSKCAEVVFDDGAVFYYTMKKCESSKKNQPGEFVGIL